MVIFYGSLVPNYSFMDFRKSDKDIHFFIYPYNWINLIVIIQHGSEQ